MPIAQEPSIDQSRSRPPGFWGSLRRDFAAVFERDPAARYGAEVVLLYPGFHAVLTHRVAHVAWGWGLKFIARAMAHAARVLTGIDIHPGAVIGPGFFIDHGAGVVIGETSQLGENVTLYQGVTLGGISREKGKRHPTLGDRVVVGANAVILGPIVVGDDVRVGSLAVVVDGPIAPHTTVVGNPGQPVAQYRRNHEGVLEHQRLPHPTETAIKELAERIAALERAVELLQSRSPDRPGPGSSVK